MQKTLHLSCLWGVAFQFMARTLSLAGWAFRPTSFPGPFPGAWRGGASITRTCKTCWKRIAEQWDLKWLVVWCWRAFRARFTHMANVYFSRRIEVARLEKLTPFFFQGQRFRNYRKISKFHWEAYWVKNRPEDDIFFNSSHVIGHCI